MQSKPHRIKPPKFKVDQYVLNEYELRHLQVQVAKKEVPNEGLIVEQGGVRARFLPDGRLTANLPGYAILSNFTIELLKIDREKP